MMRKIILCLSLLSAVFLMLGQQAVVAQTISPDNFQRAIETAKPGAALLLAPGDYPPLKINSPLGSADHPVILRSLDPAKPAIFPSLDLNGAANLVFEGVVFDYRFKPEHNAYKLRPMQVTKSRNITFRNVLFHGDNARGTGSSLDGYGAAFGLAVRFSQNIHVENATFYRWHRGLVVSQTEGFSLTKSIFAGMSSDGADFAEVRNVRIEENLFHAFDRAEESKDHPDMIQFWTAGTTTPSSDIVISNNVLNAGTGYWTQSIFMRNELVDTGKAGRDMYYRDIRITGNVIINAHLHGITVGETHGLDIRNNTLIRSMIAKGPLQKSEGLATPSIRVKPKSVKVAIQGNLVGNVEGPEKATGWTVSDNLLISPKASAGASSYGRVFLSALNANTDALGHYAYRDDGAAAQGDLGSHLLRHDTIDWALRDKGASPQLLSAIPKISDRSVAMPQVTAPLITAEPVSGTENRFRFSVINPPEGQSLPTWSLEDGQTLSAKAIEVDFAKPGKHHVTLGSESGSLDVNVVVPDPQVFAITAGQSIPSISIPFADLAGSGPVLVLGEMSDPPIVPQKIIKGIFGAKYLTLDLRLKTDSKHRNPAGEVLRVHPMLVLSITPTGAAEAVLMTTDNKKPITLRSPPLRLHDGQWHEISLSYDADQAVIILRVDGQAVSKKPATGKLPEGKGHGLAFGNPFGKKTFDGFVSDIRIIARAGQYVETDGQNQIRALP